MEATELHYNGEPVATVLVKDNNKAIFEYLIEVSLIDMKNQCIINLN